MEVPRRRPAGRSKKGAPKKPVERNFNAGGGNRCLYAQRLGSLDKRRLGSPFAVKHFHRNIAGRSHIGLGRGRLIFSLVTRHSNILTGREHG
jgi:hypothetical protein